MDRGAWQATVHGTAKNRTQLKRLSTHTCMQRGSLYEGWRMGPDLLHESLIGVKCWTRDGAGHLPFWSPVANVAQLGPLSWFPS